MRRPVVRNALYSLSFFLSFCSIHAPNDVVETNIAVLFVVYLSRLAPCVRYFLFPLFRLLYVPSPVLDIVQCSAVSLYVMLYNITLAASFSLLLRSCPCPLLLSFIPPSPFPVLYPSDAIAQCTNSSRTSSCVLVLFTSLSLSLSFSLYTHIRCSIRLPIFPLAQRALVFTLALLYSQRLYFSHPFPCFLILAL